MEVTIYHNPRCSKSRKTLELIREQGIEPCIVEYLDNPPSVDELADMLERLGKEPHDVIRPKEARELGIDPSDLARSDLLAKMVEHPILIERPLVVAGERVGLGRPPESVLELL